MILRNFTRTLLLICLTASALVVSAQDGEMLTRDLNYSRFGVPVITEEKGDGWLNIYYEVRAGNTLYSISRQFGLTVDDLRAGNDLPNNVITVGQRLLVVREEVPLAQASAGDEAAQLQLTPAPARPSPLPSAPPVIPAPAPQSSTPAPVSAGDLIIIDNLDDVPENSKNENVNP
jgi:hypothetical protein